MAAAAAALSTGIAQKGRVNPWLIAITVTLATFMELLDTAIANVSLPHIAGGVATSYDESTWVLTSYLGANAVVLPLTAWLSRVFGRKNYYMACVALFSVSSLMCGPVLVTHITNSNQALRVNLAAIANRFTGHGYSASDAAVSAMAQVYAIVQRQASILASLDCFWLLGLVAFLGPALAIFIRKFNQGGSAAAH